MDSVENLKSVAQLYGAAQNYNDTVNTYGSKGLIYTAFAFDAGAVTAVEVRIEAQRYARIVDSRVQLYLNGTLGTNVADDSTENIKTYNGQLGAYWGMESVDVSLATFGVLVDFAPRNDMPSSNNLLVRSVRMRVNYSSS